MLAPRRQRLRLSAYDYARPGAYFVTVFTARRVPLFGHLADGRMLVNDFGQIVAACWSDLPRHYPHIRLDAFVVMPNHIHGVIILRGYAEGTEDAADAAADNAGVADNNTDVHHGNNLDAAVGAGLRPARPSINHVTDADDVTNLDDELGRPAPTSIDAVNTNGAVKRHALPEIVRAFKSFPARRINEFRRTPGQALWQRNYSEHVVRSQAGLAQIRTYILDNSARWTSDTYDSPVPSGVGRPT